MLLTVAALFALPIFGISFFYSGIITQSGIEIAVITVLIAFAGIVTLVRRIAYILRRLLAK